MSRGKLTLIAAASLVLAGCGGTPPSSGAPARHGAPPTAVCGTTLSVSLAGAVVLDATAGPLPTITDTTVGGLILLKVAPGCDHGDRVTLTPPDQGQIIKTAPAGDGTAAAVVIRPIPGAKFHVTGTGATTFDVAVHLTPAPLPT